MSSSNRSRRAVVCAAALLALALAGCNIRPLYGTVGANAPAQEQLAAIEIEPATTREGQVLRNALIFMFQRGGEAAPTRYRLRMIVNHSKNAVAVEELADVPAAYLVAMTASFLLTDVATGQTLLTGSSFANASYDFSSQRFANLRAAQDAEDRAAKVIADDIRTRIAVHFAKNG